MKWTLPLVLFGLPVVLPVLAEDKPATLQLEAGGTEENLDHGYTDWHSGYVEGEWKLGERKTVYGMVRETERFELRDSEALAGGYYPVAERWAMLLEASTSPTHRVLPAYSVLAQIERSFAHGIGVQLGGRYTEYTESRLNQGVVTVEDYFGNFRAAYTYYASSLDGGDTDNAHRFALGYYYSDRSSVGLAWSSGREAESLGNGVVQLTDVRSATLIGRHWFTLGWAVSYEYGSYDYIDRYRRNLMRLGIRHEF